MQKRLRQEVIERDRVCLVCGGPGEEVHHLLSRGYKGAWDIRNMALVCHACHQKAGSHRMKVALIKLLKTLYGYEYAEMGERWAGLEREGE